MMKLANDLHRKGELNKVEEMERLSIEEAMEIIEEEPIEIICKNLLKTV